MRDREPTIRSRELGEGLRKAMFDAGMNGSEAARQLGWSSSRVSRLLSGKRGGSELDVATFLGVCRVTAEERDRLLDLCHEQNTPGWLQQHGSRLPKQVRTLIDHENKAVEINEFQPLLIPGLLQTGDYARAVISNNVNTPEEEIEDRVAARLARQALFTRRPPVQFSFFIHQPVLRTPVGGSTAMSDQLHHLLRMSVRTYLSLRIVPTVIGAHSSMAGAFKLMEFADFKPVAYLDSETSCLFLEKSQEIEAYRNVLAAMAETALSEGQSKELIEAVVVELYADREDHDDHT